mmetsp:Transcript_5521/g.13480  ORF Transcript_5521/g.13480 Transcript_5521/m.13480 type:complete len:220 (-) Transcript_5521:179-838(-)
MAAAVLSQNNPPPNIQGVSLLATQEHCKHCFDVLLTHYRGASSPRPQFPEVVCSLFVTWKKAHAAELRLRGCIGTFEPKNIHSALKEYALTSALRDRRFEPIHEKELEHLHCTVSLIYGFEKRADCLDWEIGKHGLIINFQDPRTSQRRSATFLPEVPAGEGWTKRRTIENLVRKAGYGGLVSEELLAQIQLTTYVSSPHSMSYAEYCLLAGPKQNGKS